MKYNLYNIFSGRLRTYGAIALGMFLVLTQTAGSSAQTIAVNTMQVGTSIGNVSTLAQFFNFLANLFKYLGWAGVVIGVVIIIALLIYKLIGSDDTEAMKKVQAGITKAIIIVVLGLLLVGAGFLVTVLASLFGATTVTYTITT